MVRKTAQPTKKSYHAPKVILHGTVGQMTKKVTGTVDGGGSMT